MTSTQLRTTPVEAWTTAVAEAVWMPEKQDLEIFAELTDAYEVLVLQPLTGRERRRVERWWGRLNRELAYRAMRARVELAVLDWKYHVMEATLGKVR